MSDQAIQVIRRHFDIRLKQVTESEYRSTSGCPMCGDGGKGSRSDRFRVFTDNSPRWWCRRCGFQGFVDEINGEKWRNLGRVEQRRRMIAAELRAQEYEIEQVALRQTALQQLRDSNNAQHYHDLLLETPSAWKYWTEEGFTERTILGFQLGYCAACPLDYPAHRPSATIPIYAQGKLWNIRHRVLGAEHGKYLPERKNLPQMMFNADNLLQAPPDYMMLVEGEKKSMACTQYGWWSVGVMGQDNFNPDWADAFNRFERVYVVLDPDALDNAHEIASLFDGRGYVVSLPDKLDDLLHKGGTDPDQVWNQIEQGERV